MVRGLMLGMVTAAVICQSSSFAQTTAGKDIVTTAVEAGSFKTLAAALQAARLVETLQGKGVVYRLRPE